MLTTGCSRPPTAHEWAAVAENPSAKPALVRKRVAVPTALATTGFSLNDEPTVKSQRELTVATSGSHNLRRRSGADPAGGADIDVYVCGLIRGSK